VEQPAERVRRLDARSLRGLAHPLRVHILGLLRLDGPSTATRLARRLGQDSGNVSWHLRQLAEHGFIAEDSARGTRRERWWHALHDTSQLDVAELPAAPETDELVAAYRRHVLAQYFDRALAFTSADWNAGWSHAAEFSDWRLELTAARLSALTAELAAVVERHRGPPQPGEPAEPGTATVHIQLQAFPRRDEPAQATGQTGE
jgi:DNA-binding transcriptional ArsR family regulator